MTDMRDLESLENALGKLQMRSREKSMAGQMTYCPPLLWPYFSATGRRPEEAYRHAVGGEKQEQATAGEAKPLLLMCCCLKQWLTGLRPRPSRPELSGLSTSRPCG